MWYIERKLFIVLLTDHSLLTMILFIHYWPYYSMSHWYWWWWLLFWWWWYWPIWFRERKLLTPLLFYWSIHDDYSVIHSIDHSIPFYSIHSMIQWCWLILILLTDVIVVWWYSFYSIVLMIIYCIIPFWWCCPLLLKLIHSIDDY